MNPPHRLLLIEGIPGSGKTDLAWNLYKTLKNQGYSVFLYTEGDLHPVDLTKNAYLSLDEYNEFLFACKRVWSKHPEEITFHELEKRIRQVTQFENQHAILAYTQIPFPSLEYESLLEDLSEREIFDGRSTLSDFKQIHLQRWSNFSANAQKHSENIYIFEGALFQSQIQELLSVYDLSKEEIFAYISKLVATVLPLHPMTYYIKPRNLAKTITEVAGKRLAPEGSGHLDWIDEQITYIETSNYGKLHNLHGFLGFLLFLQSRMEIEKYLLSKLSLPFEIQNK